MRERESGDSGAFLAWEEGTQSGVEQSVERGEC